MIRLLTLSATLAFSTSIAIGGPEQESALQVASRPPAAETPAVPVAHHAQEGSALPVALAINPTFGWFKDSPFGVSAYIGVHENLSLRFNYANYEHNADVLRDPFIENETAWMGRVIDFGGALQYFPRSVWSGLSLELGVLHRAQDTSERNSNDSPYIRDIKSSGYAAHALIGWSWLGWKRVFLAAAAGASYGRYAGSETVAAGELMVEYGPEDFVTNDFKRTEVNIEAYLRIGIAFGL